MKRGIREYPIFSGVLALILLWAGASIWAYLDARSELLVLKREYETKRLRYVDYARRTPAPTAANLALANERYARWFAVYESLMTGLNALGYDKAAFFGTTPEGRTEAFYEIAQFVERMRGLAHKNGVVLDENERFGFSAYENIGPDRPDIPLVHSQARVVEAALAQLFDSGIDRLLDVRRSSRRSGDGAAAVRAGKPLARGLADAADWFELDAEASLETEGVFAAQGVRLLFSGQSSALRSFLNRISNSGLPFAIRGIEVDVLNEQGRYSLAERLESQSSQVPIIVENRSVFTVTLEFLDLVAEVEAPAFDAQEGGGDA